ncbi:hypothetical protein Ciccas_003613 [Cichlidogyrus casuarinus]|uniref:Uncharacterized protein n=1 Tax=Cichlidogyrus casuarinus TaxID=1844966 RepID=A0ABD2QH84_9PLAT
MTGAIVHKERNIPKLVKDASIASLRILPRDLRSIVSDKDVITRTQELWTLWSEEANTVLKEEASIITETTLLMPFEFCRPTNRSNSLRKEIVGSKELKIGLKAGVEFLKLSRYSKQFGASFYGVKPCCDSDEDFDGRDFKVGINPRNLTIYEGSTVINSRKILSIHLKDICSVTMRDRNKVGVKSVNPPRNLHLKCKQAVELFLLLKDYLNEREKATSLSSPSSHPSSADVEDAPKNTQEDEALFRLSSKKSPKTKRVQNKEEYQCSSLSIEEPNKKIIVHPYLFQNGAVKKPLIVPVFAIDSHVESSCSEI